MVPFAKALVPSVDIRNQQIVIDPPEGLLDMHTAKPMRKVGGDPVRVEPSGGC